MTQLLSVIYLKQSQGELKHTIRLAHQGMLLKKH